MTKTLQQLIDERERLNNDCSKEPEPGTVGYDEIAFLDFMMQSGTTIIRQLLAEREQQRAIMIQAKEALDSCGGERANDGGLYQTYCNIRVEEALDALNAVLGDTNDK